MNLNTTIVQEATSSFPMFNLHMNKELRVFTPFLFAEKGREYPRSIISVLRDAFFPNTKGKVKGLIEKTLKIIDPECLSEDTALYAQAHKMSETAEFMFSTDGYTFKTDGKFLYVIDKGTNLPVIVYLK